jgi:putative SOS response-associated peptidase YedK
MCGRFTQSYSWSELQNFYNLIVEAAPNLRPSWNVAPTQDIDVIGLKEGGGLGLTRMRWGLVPSWAKDIAIGSRMINARADSAAEKPAFRDAFAKRRCIIPVSGFYEWQGAGRSKTPWYITAPNGAPISLAGLWDRWRAPDGSWVRSAAILTTDANDSLRPLHHRMPVVLGRSAVERWLEGGDAALLKPCPPGPG